MELANIAFDAEDPQRLAAFWSASTGRTIAQSTPHFALLTSERDTLKMLFLKVPERKTAKSRMHVDFRSSDREAEVARLVGLGATRHDTHNEFGVEWTVMTDPEGNELCVAQE